MQAVLKALSWTFVHSLWQGIVAALLAAVIISATKKTSAKFRYNLLGGILILFLSTALFTFLIEWRQQTALMALSITDTVPGNATGIAPPATLVTNISNWLNENSGLVLLTWFVFFCLHFLKLITGLIAVQRLRNFKVHPVPEEWRIKLSRLQSKLGMRETINLVQSELIKVPVALGFFKPVILLPLGLINNLPVQQIEAILLHELGHIRRSDYLVNLLQHFAEAIFFFNPAMRWISSLIRQERENCCDDIALACTNQKRNYLDALVSFEEYSARHTNYTMAISVKKQYLFNRVKRIITSENKRLNLVEKLALLSGILLFSAFTYISSEKEIKEPVVNLPAATFTILPINTMSVEGEYPLSSEQPVEKKINNPESLYKIETIAIAPVSMAAAIKDKFSQLKVDSIPVAGKKEPQVKKNEKPGKPATELEKKLGEIIKLKAHIGEKKEIIGKNKELLAKGSEEDKDRIMKKIEGERAAIEVKREDLEKKRTEYENLKKKEDEKNKSSEKVQEKKWEIKKDDNNSVADRKVTTFNIVDIKGLKTDKQFIIEEAKNKDREKTTDKNGELKKDDNNSVVDRKIITFKMVDLKEIKTDKQFTIKEQKKSSPSQVKDKPKVPGKSDLPT